MKKTIYLLSILALSNLSCFAGGKLITRQDASSPIANLSLEQWSIFELTMKGPQTGNPFMDVQLSATFTLRDKVYEPKGFYDGNGVYKVRFMPPCTGEWTYKTSSNSEKLDGIVGRFTALEATGINHGPVQVRNTYHLGYADGKPFWQIGTTCYAWVHQTDELQEQTLETLKDAPFNKIRMCVFPKDYNYNKNAPPFYPFPRKEGENDYTKFDPSFFDHFEARVADLTDLEIEADIILFHPYDRWGYSSMDAATDQFYLEYVIARLASFRNVWWSLANEYDLMKEKEMEDWDRFFKIIRENDPYDHMAGIHNCFGFYNHSEPWVSHASIQSSALDRAKEWRDQYQKPIIYDECRYEGNIFEHWGNQSAQEMTHKFWLGTIAGCYIGHGETYQHPQDILWWSKGGVLHGESPARIAFLKSILEEAPQDGIEPIDNYSGGKPGDYYLYYFGTEKPISWRFQLPENVKYEIELISTWEMTIHKLDGIFSGTFELSLPGKEYQAVRITRAGYNFPAGPVRYTPEEGLFYPFAEVTLWSEEPEAEIRYTLDGTDPSVRSSLFIEPIPMTETTTLKAMAFNMKGEKSRLTTAKFILARLVQPTEVKGLASGLRYSYYEGNWENLPDFEKQDVVDTGIIPNFHLQVKKQEDHFAIVYEGYIKVKQEGIYTFYTNSDDGSKLWIGETLVVNNDDRHGARELSGKIALQKGSYPISVKFFEADQGDMLEVSYKGPGLKKQIIPDNVLFHVR
jgi:hypothetical protein